MYQEDHYVVTSRESPVGSVRTEAIWYHPVCPAFHVEVKKNRDTAQLTGTRLTSRRDPTKVQTPFTVRVSVRNKEGDLRGADNACNRPDNGFEIGGDKDTHEDVGDDEETEKRDDNVHKEDDVEGEKKEALEETGYFPRNTRGCHTAKGLRYFQCSPSFVERRTQVTERNRTDHYYEPCSVSRQYYTVSGNNSERSRYDQKTSVADINHKTGNSDGHTQGTRCLHVEVDSPTRAHSSSSSPKVDSFRLEPLLLGGVESPGSRRPRQTALDDPIVMVARDELTGRPPVSYGTTMVSQLPRHFIDDISNSKDRINDSARRGPRRGCSLTESNFQWEEAFRKDLYYTPCVADSSESDANESGSWRRHMHIDLNQKPTTVTKSKWSTTRWDKPEWYSDHNTDGEFPSSCPEKESPIQRFTNYNLPASHPQRQRSSPSIYHKLSGYASDSRHSTVSRTVTLPEMPSNNQEDMNAPMEAPGRRERSKQFARLKLFFERNSSPKPQSSDSNIRRNKPKPGRRKNTGFKTGDLSGHSSNMEEEQSDLPRLDSVGAPSGPESSPAAINPGYKPPQSSVAKMKRYSRPTSTATLSLSPAPPQPITATVTATAVTVTTATATSTASQSISTTDQIRSQPTGKSQSSISDTVTKLTNSKNALMKEDHEKSIDKPALRGSTYAAPDTIPTREEHLSTSTITTTKSEANPPTASSMGPKLTQIGFARPKRQKTRAGSRASFSRSISAVQTTDDEDLFSGSISGWGAQPGDNIPTNSLSHVRGECDGVDPLEDPEAEHIPDLTAFKLIGSIVDSDVDSDTEGRIKIRFRGVPMPGLVGPNAQNMLAEIKQKTHLRSHETRSRSSNPVETRSPISELQRAISLLRPSSKTQNPLNEKGTEQINPPAKRS